MSAHLWPKQLVVIVGRNKIVPDVAAAMARIKHFTASANALWLSKKTPWVVTSHCQDCGSGQRICNVWTIAEKCIPPGMRHGDLGQSGSGILTRPSRAAG